MYPRSVYADRTGGGGAGDPSSALTEALGVVLDHPGPMGVLGYPRSVAACPAS